MTACEPIKWGAMYCHNSCFQLEKHEIRQVGDLASWEMIPESVYAIQRIFTKWDAGQKYRRGGFRRFGPKEYDTDEEAMAACQRHKFETMVKEIAELL